MNKRKRISKSVEISRFAVALAGAAIFIPLVQSVSGQEHQHHGHTSDQQLEEGASGQKPDEPHADCHAEHAEHESSATPQHAVAVAVREHEGGEQASEAATFWTCSMHPHFRLPKAGKCPICHMDLIPMTEGGDESAWGETRGISVPRSPLLELETSLVERRWVDRPVRMLGRIEYDESRLKHITAWVPGRVEQMFVNFTGISVKKGEHMVELFSPTLLAAQEELIQAKRAAKKLAGSSSVVARSTARAQEAAREKLRLLGLSSRQVRAIEQAGEAKDNVTIFAPMGGTVVEKNVSEGMYVETGMRLYTIADLSHLWLLLDAYESDLSWLAYGQEVEFSAEAFPGEHFRGIVSFIQPVINEATRTVKIRVNVQNDKLRLKPGMFVNAVVKARLNADGETLAPTFVGKYICPMHPEVVRSEKENCDICGMELVAAQKLPFVSEHSVHGSSPPLVIPASAPLITGTRAIVYVETEENRYQGREIVLGPRAGDHYIVRSGLAAGEKVVTSGAFKLDADLQIRGLQSMMNPEPQQRPASMSEHSGHAGH